jgi:amino acid adenylation domain-containing protein
MRGHLTLLCRHVTVSLDSRADALEAPVFNSRADLPPITSSQMRYALRAVQRDIHAARAVHGDGKLSTIGATGLIVGPFEPDVYWAAEQLVRAQSEALRSSLCDAPECGYQVVHDSAPVSPMLFDVSGAADPAASAHAWIERDFSVPFAADGLVVASRHVLFKLGEQEHLVYCKYDHALFDGWGTSLFATRLGIAYSRIIAGEVVQPVVEVSTAEMLEDEHAYLASRRHAADREYWLQRMQRYAGGYFTPATSLVNRRIVLGLDQQEMSALKHWTNAEQVGAFHFFAAVLHATLFRLVAARDLSIGLPILNRRNAREKQTIGLFLGFCCLRASASPSMSVAELARSVAVQMKADFRHQRYPLEAIAGETGGLPFEVSLSYEKHDYNVALAGSPAFVTPLQTPAQAYALKVFVRDFDNIRPIFIDFDVNDSCFGGLSPELLVETFQAVMRQALASPATQLLSIRPMRVPPTVRAQRQDTGVVVTDLCSEFERMAARTPAAVAVRGASGALDYAQLDAHANTLAASLRALDVGPEARVGLCGTRDIHFVIGMLGILKTGAAYVPLDLAYPAERLDFLIADSGVMALVGEAADLGRLPAHALPCCVIDPQEQPAAQSAAQPRRIAPQQAAYVIYTSGSTGTPKGCVITHANVLRLFEVSAAPFALGPTDVWSVFHSTAFDFSVWEIWGALLHGGSAVFVPYETSRDPQAFAAFMQQQRVSVLSQTPSAFRLLAEQPGLLPDLRLVVFGGEALESSSLREWFARYGDQRPQLVNMYGITETTVHVTARVLGSADVGGALCPIGEPLADLSLQLLDSYGEPVLPGVTGEIYVGGAGVARGYLNRPGLTATRFVPDPYGPPGSRRYRSGDLARRRADGETEYLGRADQQVKIRGFRIEPAEIEAALRLHPAVRDAAVVCERSAQGEMRLIGYVSAVAAEELEGLRAHLVAQLPAHMVPAHLIRLDTLPLTHNGKLDRGALPAPETLAPHAHEAPATPTEKLLAGIWARVLGVTPNRNDNFFALGGDSILSLRMVNEVRSAIGRAIPLQGIFSAASLRGFAAWLDTLPASATVES